MTNDAYFFNGNKDALMIIRSNASILACVVITSTMTLNAVAVEITSEHLGKLLTAVERWSPVDFDGMLNFNTGNIGTFVFQVINSLEATISISIDPQRGGDIATLHFLRSSAPELIRTIQSVLKLQGGSHVHPRTSRILQEVGRCA